MQNSLKIVALTSFKILSFPFVVLFQMIKIPLSHDGKQGHYSKGDTKPIVRSESYRTLKRRNRLMRKYTHKKDD